MEKANIGESDKYTWIWVFVGPKNNSPSAVFSTQERAHQWISHHQLTGLLTAYPLDHPVYDWAQAEEFFTPSRDHHTRPEFIQQFSSAHLEHYHYENGEC